MPTPIIYQDGNDGGDRQIAASVIALEIANSTPTITLGDTYAIPYSITVSNTIGTSVDLSNRALDEDYSVLPTSYTMQIANSTSTIALGDSQPIPISILSTNTSNVDLALEEDYNQLSASFNFKVAPSYMRTAKDSELPQGNGGPTTTQTWSIS